MTSAVDFRESISGLTADDSVLVLADIVGGSPLTTAATVLEEAGKLDGLDPWWDEPYHGLDGSCDEGCVGGRRFVSHHLIRSTICTTAF